LFCAAWAAWLRVLLLMSVVLSWGFRLLLAVVVPLLPPVVEVGGSFSLSLSFSVVDDDAAAAAAAAAAAC
jgi:hypothetical protein